MKSFIKISKLAFISVLFGFSLFLLNGCETKKPKEEVTPIDPAIDSPSEFKWWVSSDSDCVKEYDEQGCNTCTKEFIIGNNRGVFCTDKRCSKKSEERAGKCVAACIKKYDEQGCNTCTKQDNSWVCTTMSCKEKNKEKANVCLEIQDIN